jgi:hypothetical protein
LREIKVAVTATPTAKAASAAQRVIVEVAI